jgi:hypothetical protein
MEKEIEYAVIYIETPSNTLKVKYITANSPQDAADKFRSGWYQLNKGFEIKSVAECKDSEWE